MALHKNQNKNSKHAGKNQRKIMIKLKTFLKKTRRGKVLKIVREHYLRDDIRCGLELCHDCPENDEKLPSALAQLSVSPKSQSNMCQEAHFIVIDTNIILNQMDILEVVDIFFANYASKYLPSSKITNII